MHRSCQHDHQSITKKFISVFCNNFYFTPELRAIAQSVEMDETRSTSVWVVRPASIFSSPSARSNFMPPSMKALDCHVRLAPPPLLLKCKRKFESTLDLAISTRNLRSQSCELTAGSSLANLNRIPIGLKPNRNSTGLLAHVD